MDEDLNRISAKRLYNFRSGAQARSVVHARQPAEAGR